MTYKNYSSASRATVVVRSLRDVVVFTWRMLRAHTKRSITASNECAVIRVLECTRACVCSVQDFRQFNYLETEWLRYGLRCARAAVVQLVCVSDLVPPNKDRTVFSRTQTHTHSAAHARLGRSESRSRHTRCNKTKGTSATQNRLNKALFVLVSRLYICRVPAFCSLCRYYLLF